MKKLTLLITIAIFGFAVSACNQKKLTDSDNSYGYTSYKTDDSKTEIDLNLLRQLENRVSTTRPGTAGTTLKAVYAAKDLLGWLQENELRRDTVKETVRYFIENSKYKEEAKQAFDSITHIFNMLKEGKAYDLLDSAGINIADFEASPQVKEFLDILINAIKEYNLPNQ